MSASAAAEAAGVSRVTLGRIEADAPSLTIGAYVAALAALGLDLEVRDPSAPSLVDPAVVELPVRVRLADFPALQRLAWQLDGTSELSPQHALALYERNWRHVDVASLAKAIERLRAQPHRLDDCMRALHMTALSKAQLWQAIRRLRPKAAA